MRLSGEYKIRKWELIEFDWEWTGVTNNCVKGIFDKFDFVDWNADVSGECELIVKKNT